MDAQDRDCTAEGPFTGEAFTLHPDGSLYATTQYKNGFADGVSRRFHANGSTALEGVWRHGMRIGVYRRWYEDGTLKAERDYTGGGLPTGKRFNPDGTPAARRKAT